MLILDYMMSPINGDKVVEKVREFNDHIYILLLTGHKDMAPPLETIKALEIQGYSEKTDRFDQLILLIESGIKSIKQMRTIRKFRDGLNKILEAVPKIYQLQPIGSILEGILIEVMYFVNSENAFILVDSTGRRAQHTQQHLQRDRTVQQEHRRFYGDAGSGPHGTRRLRQNDEPDRPGGHGRDLSAHQRVQADHRCHLY